MNKLVRMRDVQDAIDNLEWYPIGVKVYVRQTELVDAIDSIPAVDAVEVVRCRECIHRKKYQDDEQQGDTICTLEWKMKKLDWFCADGQRREDGDA